MSPGEMVLNWSRWSLTDTFYDGMQYPQPLTLLAPLTYVRAGVSCVKHAKNVVSSPLFLLLKHETNTETRSLNDVEFPPDAALMLPYLSLISSYTQESRNVIALCTFGRRTAAQRPPEG